MRRKLVHSRDSRDVLEKAGVMEIKHGWYYLYFDDDVSDSKPLYARFQGEYVVSKGVNR